MSARSRNRRRAAVDLLVECLREPQDTDDKKIRDLALTVSPPDLLHAAAYHAVSGFVFKSLVNRDLLTESAIAELRRRYDGALRHHLKVTWELRRLAPVLDGSRAFWAVVKGPALVELVYGDGGLRSYADIDVVVEPGAFDRVLDALGEADLHPQDRNWRAIRRSMLGELHYALPGGTPLDLHWHLVNMYRGRMSIPTHQLVARAVRVPLGGVEAPTLEATDALLHLTLHGTLSGGDRLLWIKDVATSATVRPPDWDELVRRAVAWRVEAPAGFMLMRAKQTLSAPIPDGVPERLLGGGYRALTAVVDWLSPWQQAEGRLTSGSLLMTRSMGLGLRGAAAWLVGRTLRHFDPREPERSSTFSPAGGPAERDAFVRAVVASGKERESGSA